MAHSVARSGTFQLAFAGALLLTLPGCVGTSSSIYPADAPARPATNAPARFMVGTIPAGGAPTEPVTGSACRNPMVDPRDGTQLRLVQSQPGANGHVGDYAVPDERYGSRAGELLRIHCGTGHPIGWVPAPG